MTAPASLFLKAPSAVIGNGVVARPFYCLCHGRGNRSCSCNGSEVAKAATCSRSRSVSVGSSHSSSSAAAMEVDDLPMPLAKRRRFGKDVVDFGQCTDVCSSAGTQAGQFTVHGRPGRPSPLAVLFRRVRRRACDGRGVYFAPLIVQFFQALGPSPGPVSPVVGGPAPSYAQARAELERLAEETGKAERGARWRDTFQEEMREYRIFELDEKSWFPVFFKDIRTITLNVHPELTVEQVLDRLRVKVGALLHGGQLKFAGFGMHAEDRALWEYGISKESTIYCSAGLF